MLIERANCGADLTYSVADGSKPTDGNETDAPVCVETPIRSLIKYPAPLPTFPPLIEDVLKKGDKSKVLIILIAFCLICKCNMQLLNFENKFKE
jgi:hypothetical protein